MPLAFYRMRDEVALGLIAAAFSVFLFILLPNYQQFAYQNTEAKEYDKYEHYVGYPAADGYPTVDSVEKITKKEINTFTIEADITRLKAIDLYMDLEGEKYSTSVFSRILSNKDTERMGRFFLLTLDSGETVIVFLDDLTINLPKEGKVTLPIGKVVKYEESNLFDRLKEISGIEDIEFYIDMAGDWKDGKEAAKVEHVRAFFGVVFFFGLWIVYSKLLIRLGEKK